MPVIVTQFDSDARRVVATLPRFGPEYTWKMSSSPHSSPDPAADSEYFPDYRSPTRALVFGLVFLWIAACVAALWRGPSLGDHEVIVAQIAKQSIETGEWIIPHYLDTPFLVKPPLSPWLVGLTSQLGEWLGLRRDIGPVTDTTARLPSVMAVLLTVLVVHRLGRSMFDARTGLIAAFVFACSLGALLFAFNATAEALLTLFCTWAFAEFWYAMHASTAGGRRVHLLLFYLAFGLAMLAKGPMPLMLVGPAIALWWWLHRPLEALAESGPGGIGASARLGFTDAWPRLRQALTGLGLWWGVPIFLAIFVPWMILVGRQIPDAWQLWNYEYLDRLQGHYPGSKSGRYYYYIPIVFGLAVPWALSLPEALAAPFLRKYRAERRPLLFLWFWVIVGVIMTSFMTFKKSYYILPVLPACSLLLAPVLREFFFRVRSISARVAWLGYAAMLAVWVIGWIVLWRVAHRMYPEVWHGSIVTVTPWIAVGITLAVAVIGLLYLRRHRRLSFVSLGLTSVISFALVWCTIGPSIDNLEAPTQLVQGLKAAGVPPEADVYWAGNRPDGRVVFYGGRNLRQVVDPYKLIVDHADVEDEDSMRIYVGSKICRMLKSDETVYIIFQREQLVLLKMFCDPPMNVILSVDRGKSGPCDDDWVVVTNHLRTAALN